MGVFGKTSAQMALRDPDSRLKLQVRDDDPEALAELVDRYHAFPERLLLCRDRLRELSLHRYLGDVAL